MRRMGLFLILFIVFTAGAAFAAEGGEAGVVGGTSFYWAVALAAGFAIGFAAFGGALAQGRAASAALEGIARNPGAAGQLLTPMIIGLALIESLVIYAFVIAILLQGKIPGLG